MGLLSIEVEVLLSGKNIKHFENLGYEIPRENFGYGDVVPKGTTIRVKVKDLLPQSNVKVNIEYDCCHKTKMITYKTYNERNHDGKLYCRNCAANIFISGKNNWNYNPNLTDEDRVIGRSYPEYTEFVRNVLARDKYTCQCCGQEHGDLEVHHLYGYSAYPEYRLDQTQAITLCARCHSAFHNWHCIQFGYNNRGNCTKEQYEEWFGKSVTLSKNNIEIVPTRKVYCFENDTVYNGAVDIEKKLHIGRGKIYNICNNRVDYMSVDGYHFIWHDIYLEMDENERNMYYQNAIKCDNHSKIICITTGDIFNSYKEAGEFCGVKQYFNISQCCKNNKKTSGKLSDGRKLQWMYYDEYLEKINDIEKILIPDERIICTTTNEIYPSLKDATNAYPNLYKANVSKCCKGKVKTSGKLPDGTPLRWMYYGNFLKLPQEEQNKILTRNKDSSFDESFNM